MSQEGRQRWFAHILDIGLEQRIFEPADVLAHVTPEVLSAHLPPDLMSRVLATALTTGSMTPDGVLKTLTPEVLSQHIPHEILWSCVAAAAQRAGLVGEAR